MTKLSIEQLFDLGYKAIVNSKEGNENAIFFALKGKKTDGHHFLHDFAQRGGRYAVISNTYVGPTYGLITERSPDPLLSLQVYGKERLKRLNPFVIAITGSFGKTTTRSFIAHLLSERFLTYQSEGNQNSQIGLPLTLLHFPVNTEMLVLEMGMSGEGMIRSLINIAPAHFVVITAIGHAHIEFFPDGVEGIARAKGEILESTKMLKAFISQQASQFAPFNQLRSECVEICNTPKYFPSHLPDHFQSNVALACAVAKACGVTDESIEKRVETLSVVDRRFECKHHNGVLWVNDAYNATPLTFEAGLKSLPKTQGKVYAILGEMREIGTFSKELHTMVAEMIPEEVHEVISVGEGAKIISELLTSRGRRGVHLYSHDEIRSHLFPQLQEGDIVYVKGASGLCLWEIIP